MKDWAVFLTIIAAVIFERMVVAPRMERSSPTIPIAPATMPRSVADMVKMMYPNATTVSTN